jgi:hypothetical protein
VAQLTYQVSLAVLSRDRNTIPQDGYDDFSAPALRCHAMSAATNVPRETRVQTTISTLVAALGKARRDQLQKHLGVEGFDEVVVVAAKLAKDSVPGPSGTGR